ncbi:MAG: PAS domain S-box protein [Anaerosomatales bacterium]|nr:PAS domain S-box protein [Anaerosomatales bacterium]
MEWMLAAISAPLSASIITAVLFFAFARSERDKALTLLAWSWVVYASRLTFEAVALLIPAAPWIWYLVQVAAVASALLMLSGVARLVGTRAPWRIFLAFGLAAVAALYVLGQTELHPAIVAMPSFALQGVARIMTGVALLKVERERGAFPTAAGIAFIVWGLHAFDYPLRWVFPDWFGYAGYLLSSVLVVTVAFATVMSYLSDVRSRLAVSEARYRSLFQDSASVMLLIDPADGSIKDANKAAERFYGWSRDELVRMRVSDINTLSPDEIKAEMERARTLQKNHFEFKHRLARGEIRDVDVYSGPVVGEGGQTWLYSIVHDVTDRAAAQRALAESEARYRTIFEESEQAMLLVDPVGARIVDANAAAAALYGWTEAELESKSIADLSAHDGLDVVLSEVDKALHAGQHFGAYQHRTASGEIRDVEIYATPLWFSGKQMLFTVVMDVTARKEVERELERYRRGLEDEVAERTAQLEEAYEQLESANRAKDEFLRSMSHELRTPLNSVIGFARLLEQELPGPLNDEQKKQIRMIRDSGMHLLSLVDDVLDLSRIEEGRVKVERVDVDLGVLARDAVAAVKPLADEKGLVLELRGEPSLRCATDPQLVRQIVWNLLSNAIKYTSQGSVTVSVEDAGAAARIAVADTGPGMASDQIEHAFDAFTRFRPPGDSPGTGLGLAISKRLAELLGARLLVESTPGVGSTFTLEIPC